MTSDLNISHGKMSDFVSSPLFGFTFAIKLWNCGFEGDWNTLTFFGKKMLWDLNLSCQTVSDLI